MNGIHGSLALGAPKAHGLVPVHTGHRVPASVVIEPIVGVSPATLAARVLVTLPRERRLLARLRPCEE